MYRDGKSCEETCGLEYLPRCLAVGCYLRRLGKRCDCPRTPLYLCEHVQAKIAEHASLTPQQAAIVADHWSELLWALHPQTYGDRPPPASGCTVRAGEPAANVMAARQAMGLALWHPADRRLIDAEAMRRMADGLKRLLGVGAAMGGDGPKGPKGPNGQGPGRAA